MTIMPESYHRRSFVYPRLVAAGAEFGDIADAAVATAFPAAAAPALGLADLSPLPRTGIKGPRAIAWLGEQGWPVPQANNAAELADSGNLVLRLGDRELVVAATAEPGCNAVLELEASIAGGGAWHVPRRDSNCAFLLRGPDAVDCLAKLCGVDLRTEHFPPGSIAQTSVARINAIVCRDFGHEVPTFLLLADCTSAIWFWDTLLDAMSEFDGGPLGLRERG